MWRPRSRGSSARTMVSTSGNSGMQINAVLLHGYGNGRDVGAITYAGAAVELPGVPRAYDRVVVEGAFSERRAAVRANAIKREDLTVHVAEYDFPIIHANLRHATGWQFRHAPDADGYHVCNVPCAILLSYCRCWS